MADRIIRTAHGNGAGALLRAETPPIDELPAANAADTEAGLAVYEARGRPFEAGNSAATGRKPKLARMPSSDPKAHPSWDRYRKQASRYAKRRVSELAIMHGGRVSAGVAAMLVNASLAMAASRVVYEQASETLDAKLFAQAAKLADMSRQQELTALGIARLEAESFQEDDETRVRRERLETARTLTPRTDD